MQLPTISAGTAATVVAGIAGVCLLVYLKADVQVVGAYGAAFVMLAGSLEKLFPGDKGGAS